MIYPHIWGIVGHVIDRAFLLLFSELTNNGYLPIYRKYGKLAHFNSVRVLNFDRHTLMQLLVSSLILAFFNGDSVKKNGILLASYLVIGSFEQVNFHLKTYAKHTVYLEWLEVS